jgi:hypothetical protein
MSVILRIEHPVGDFARWQRAYDSDPVGREQGGVRRHRIMRAVDDRSYVLVDLEFDERGAAEKFLAQLRALWDRVEVITDPRGRIVELVEERELARIPSGRSMD